MSELKKRLEQLQAVQKWCLQSESASRINAALDLARSEEGIPILPGELDRDPWLFNCPNGTLELKTGVLREHRREDLITKLCPTPYESRAMCDSWLRFLDSIFQKNEDLIVFVQRLLGRCLTGDVSEQILPIFWGAGSNGKTTLLNTVAGVLGSDYVITANEDLLTRARGERHPTELAQLFGVRLVIASETEEEVPLNEKRIKALTGGERIRARRMREDHWEFNPTHKLILVTNHKPRVRGRDHAIWRRLRLVPFEVCFWDQDEPKNQDKQLPPELRADKQLPARLRQEYPGILAWLVQGCLDWQSEGLTLPDAVQLATAAYREAEDQLTQFVTECCMTGHGDYRVRSSDAYTAYARWAKRVGEHVHTQRAFCNEMTQRYEKQCSNGVWYKGVALTPDEQEANRREG